jgi:CDP-paratose 2-epimerase
VRDILFVEDLVDALLLARDSMESVRGQAFNLGGGPQNTVSLRELILELGRLRGNLPEVRYEEWRASDQRYYVSDVSRFKAATGWAPRTSVREGVERMTEWMVSPQPVAPAVATGRAAL